MLFRYFIMNMIFLASTNSTTPLPSARISTRESRATLSFQTCTYDRSFRTDQRNSLALHVRSHQAHGWHHHAQGKESVKPQPNNLVWSNVHIFQILRLNNREVPFKRALTFSSIKFSFVFIRYFCLCDLCVSSSSAAKEYYLILHLHFSIFNFTIRSFDESHLVHLCMNTKGRDQTDVWTFRSFNGTKTTIVRIVNVTNFKACTFT